MRRVVFREANFTEMIVEADGEAKAFAKQLIRDHKGFELHPTRSGWTFIVYEENHPSRWEAA